MGGWGRRDRRSGKGSDEVSGRQQAPSYTAFLSPSLSRDTKPEGELKCVRKKEGTDLATLAPLDPALDGLHADGLPWRLTRVSSPHGGSDLLFNLVVVLPSDLRAKKCLPLAVARDERLTSGACVARRRRGGIGGLLLPRREDGPSGELPTSEGRPAGECAGKGGGPPAAGPSRGCCLLAVHRGHSLGMEGKVVVGRRKGRRRR